MEFEIKPGVFIGTVTRGQWESRVDILDGEDLKHFIEKCNPFSMARDQDLKKALGVSLSDLWYVLKEIEPGFHAERDYYTVRNSPIKSKL